MKDIQTCESCGAYKIVYKRGLRWPTISLLYNMALEKRPMKIGSIPGMTTSQYADFKRLCLWGLIDETRDASVYQVTDFGMLFLMNDTAIPEYIWTYRNEIVGPPAGEVVKNINVSQVRNYEITKLSILRESTNRAAYTHPEGDLFANA